MSLINTFNKSFSIDTNFWELNPYLVVMSPFSELYKRDKSKGKDKSSREMWAIYLYCDSRPDNKLYRMNKEQRLAEVKENYYNLDTNDKVIKKIIDNYDILCMDNVERAFKTIEDKMAQRNQFLMNTSYNLETYKMIEEMLKQSKQVFETHKTLKQSLIEKEAKIEGKGERKLTKSEKGEF